MRSAPLALVVVPVGVPVGALAVALAVALAGCGSRTTGPVVATRGAAHLARRPPPPPAPLPPADAGPPAPPPAPALPGLAAPLPEALVRPRLVGLVRAGAGWAAALEESPATGERVVFRALDDPARDLAPPFAVAPPLAWAVTVVDGALVLTGDTDGRLVALEPGDATPRPLAHLPDAPLRAASSRLALARRGTELGGVAVARVPDDDVHPFAHPHEVAHEHVEAYPVGPRSRRPVVLDETEGLVTAWLAAAASDAESATVRVEAARPRGDSLDGTARAVVHVMRLRDAATRTTTTTAPPGVTLDAIAAFAADGTLAVAFLDAHAGAHALVMLSFPPARGPATTTTLDAPGPLADGDAALVACDGALYALTATEEDLGLQRALPTVGERRVLYRGEMAHEGHVLAAACDGDALVVALERAPALRTGTLVSARVPL